MNINVTPREVSASDAAKTQLRPVAISLLIDLITAGPVLFVAVMSGSILLMTDFVDYAKGFGADLLSWNILRKIKRDETGDYDYGPGKLEVIGGLAGSLVFITGVIMLAGFAFFRILHPNEVQPEFTLVGALFMFCGFFINSWLWMRFRREANRSATPIMEMQWRAKRADALASLAVFIALVATLVLRSFSWSIYIDPVCALLFVLYAVGSFIPSMKTGVQDLLDKTLAEDIQLKIMRRLADNFERYEGFHGVRSRRSGSRLFIEIALSFDPAKTIEEAVETMTRLQEGIEADLPNSDVSIVVRPVEQFLPGREKKTLVRILPLSPTTIDRAMDLIKSTFPLEPNEMPRLELEECLNPGRHTAVLAQTGISDPAYWVAFHNNKMVGVGGLYYCSNDRNEAVWGGWTAFDAEHRTGLSRTRYLLLRKLLIEAKATGRKYLRLCTSTAPIERQANHLYDRMELNVYRTKPGTNGILVLYRQAEIERLLSSFLIGSRGKKES